MKFTVKKVFARSQYETKRLIQRREYHIRKMLGIDYLLKTKEKLFGAIKTK